MSNEPVVGNSEVKKLEERVRELERMLGRKTLEAEILREAISKAQTTKQISRPILLPKEVPDEDTSRDELRPEDHIGNSSSLNHRCWSGRDLWWRNFPPTVNHRGTKESTRSGREVHRRALRYMAGTSLARLSGSNV